MSATSSPISSGAARALLPPSPCRGGSAGAVPGSRGDGGGRHFLPPPGGGGPAGPAVGACRAVGLGLSAVRSGLAGHGHRRAPPFSRRSRACASGSVGARWRWRVPLGAAAPGYLWAEAPGLEGLRRAALPVPPRSLMFQ